MLPGRGPGSDSTPLVSRLAYTVEPVHGRAPAYQGPERVSGSRVVSWCTRRSALSQFAWNTPQACISAGFKGVKDIPASPRSGPDFRRNCVRVLDTWRRAEVFNHPEGSYCDLTSGVYTGVWAFAP